MDGSGSFVLELFVDNGGDEDVMGDAGTLQGVSPFVARLLWDFFFLVISGVVVATSTEFHWCSFSGTNVRVVQSNFFFSAREQKVLPPKPAKVTTGKKRIGLLIDS